MASKIERIGVLFVHGIGEQRTYEHLENEARQIIRALKAHAREVLGLEEEPEFGVSVRTSRDAVLRAEQELWRGEAETPVCVVIRHPEHADQRIEVHLHEVWWADVNEPVNLGSHLRFWFWGLGQWNVKRYAQSSLQGAIEEMRPPTFRASPDATASKPTQFCLRHPGFCERLELFGVGVVFLLALLSLSLANFVLKRLSFGRIPGPDILVRYIGDVKLYQQREWEDRGPLNDMYQPPRVAIRRRLVRGMVDMALAGYDRWYVLAHSLGTVVAWNGLMETEHALANFLDQEHWERCSRGGLAATRGPAPARMRPPRPPWLSTTDALDRRKLFAKLQGFLTYGSPLDKFAYLWPAIVPLNNDEAVFRPGFEWVNIYDNTDPVGAYLDAFDPVVESKGDLISAKPNNLAYITDLPILLISHIRYLRFWPDGRRTFRLLPKANGLDLPRRLATWLLQGQRFPRPSEAGEPRWPRPERERRIRAWQFAQWVFACYLLAFLVSLWLIPTVTEVWNFVWSDEASLGISGGWTSMLPGSTWGETLPWLLLRPIAFILAGAVIVLGAGFILRWWEEAQARGTDSRSPPLPM